MKNSNENKEMEKLKNILLKEEKRLEKILANRAKGLIKKIGKFKLPVDLSNVENLNDAFTFNGVFHWGKGVTYINNSDTKEETYPSTMTKREKVAREIDNNASDEVLKYSILNSDEPILIHSPIGVNVLNKKIKEFDDNPTILVPRNYTSPEEITGTTTFKDKKAQYVPPRWYTDLVAKCEKEPDKKHVLYIDDITNVEPGVQSQFYFIFLNRSINYQCMLPKNCVVVAKDTDSKYYYPIPESINNHFAHIYYEAENKKDLDAEKEAE